MLIGAYALNGGPARGGFGVGIMADLFGLF